MAEANLTQTDADLLIAMEKHRIDAERHVFPTGRGSLTVPLVSADKREQFLLDLRRGRIDLAKVTMQNRGRQVVVLVRIDVGGPPHRNPDGEIVPCPHLHRYREGFADKWAEPLPAHLFPDPTKLWDTYQQFLAYCNVSQPPDVDRGLFA